jgi:hypothetical protein
LSFEESASQKSRESKAIEEERGVKGENWRTSSVARIKHWTGLDRAIGFTVMARGWLSFAGLVTVLLIAHFLSAAEQGYYYTFSSLVALQIVFELGFSYVILQLTAHERAHLQIDTSGGISGCEVAHSRLASVLQKAVKWYTAAALLMAGTLLPAGMYFFTTHQGSAAHVSWKLPWICVVLAAACTFQIDPILSFMEGCGLVADVARLRFSQACTGSLLGWTALVTHHGLFAPAMMIAGQAIAGIFFLVLRRRLLLPLMRRKTGNNIIDWRTEIWPFQWRIGVSWLCGYFIFQLFNPVLFAFQGAVVAGRMGMTLNVVTAIQSVAISWVSTKTAPLCSMIARKEYHLLDTLFFRSVKQALAVSVIGALVIWLGVEGLNFGHFALANRLLSPLCVGLLLAASTVNIVVTSEAIYLRAHKQEKFLGVSVLSASLIGASTYFLGKYQGAAGVVFGYLGLTVCVSLVYGTHTFIKYRRLWHAT